MNEQELEIEIRESTTWNRPSWKFGTKNLNYDFEKAFRQFNEQKKPDKNNNVWILGLKFSGLSELHDFFGILLIFKNSSWAIILNS